MTKTDAWAQDPKRETVSKRKLTSDGKWEMGRLPQESLKKEKKKVKMKPYNCSNNHLMCD